MKHMMYLKGSSGKSYFSTHIILFCAILTCGVALSSAADWWPFGDEKKSKSKSGQANTAEVIINEAPVSRDTKLTTSFSDVIKQASPAVVSIKTSSYVSNQRVHPFFREFFKMPEQQKNGERQLRPRGIGSGVVVSKDGYILTNNHVIEGADEILIDFADKDEKEFPATIVGTDPRTDLAVLKLDMDEELPAATLGNSDQLEVGDIVLAIGNPFGLGQTVTMGIISATGRKQVIPQRSGVLYQDFIQTDASINQGNSGGALVDAEGRLIGINTAIFSRTGENLGIGFAVPIKMARNVMEQLIESGKVSRGYIGVNIDEVSEDLAEFSGLESGRGALITKIEDGSPAEKAGLKNGDIILKVGDTEILTVSDLLLSVSQETPGTEVDVVISRDGKNETVPVTLIERPDETERSMENKEPKESEEEEVGGKLFTGIKIQDVTTQARTQLKLPEEISGAVITKVTPNSPGARAGLRRGMVIMEISAGKTTKAITNADEAIKFSKTVKSKIARLYVYDDGAYRYFVLKE